MTNVSLIRTLAKEFSIAAFKDFNLSPERLEQYSGIIAELIESVTAELKAEVARLKAALVDATALPNDWPVEATKAAGSILTYLGWSVSPSLEPGDRVRDKVASMIEQYAIRARALSPKDETQHDHTS